MWGEEGIVGAASAFYGGEVGEGRTQNTVVFFVCVCSMVSSLVLGTQLASGALKVFRQT